MQINILEAKNRLSQLIKSAQAGEDVVIANRGEPVVRLVRANAEHAPSTGTGRPRDILDWLDQNPLPAHARRTPDEIEAGIREERNAWD